jgi:hypothetical protein
MLLAAWLGLVLGGVPILSPCHLVTLSPCQVSAAEATPAPQAPTAEQRLRRDVTFLASDECEGRGPTTLGIDRAADYIAAEFKKAGLEPGSDGSYFQPFPIAAAVLDAPASLSLAGPRGQEVELKQGVQFWPLGMGKAGKDTAPAVFAGYGISNPKAGYDDYEGLDVADKVVVILQGPPRPGDDALARTLDGGSLAAKLANAHKHQAAAVLLVNDRETARTGDDLLDFNFTALDRRGAGLLPAFHVRRDVLQEMLDSRGESLEDLERAIDRDLKPHGRALTGWQVSLEVRMRRDKVLLKNVVGVLEGAGPLARETVVVGAHYDHLGYGSLVSSLSRLRRKAIHHGADDNGSGTTALMELARRFGEMPGRKGRRLVFVAFSGEEEGLFGSEYYCKHPPFPLADTAAMFNLDMVGRLRKDDRTGKDRILTEGSGTAKGFPDLLERLAARYDLKLSNKPSGFGPSDHASFCAARVPVLFLWTDYHEDYHRPSDTADKINVPGLRKVVDVSVDAVEYLAAVDPRPAYVELKQPTHRTAGGDGPRLGIMPNYGADGEGVVLGGVAPGLPAARAGLQKDDRIIELAGKPIKDIETYMEVLYAQKRGATIDVVVVRDGKKVPFKVKLD